MYIALREASSIGNSLITVSWATDRARDPSRWVSRTCEALRDYSGSNGLHLMSAPGDGTGPQTCGAEHLPQTAALPPVA
jgi:hypothetical protein